MQKSIQIDSTDFPSGSVSYFVGGGHTGFNQDGGKQAPAQYQFVEMEGGNLLFVWAKEDILEGHWRWNLE